VRPGNWAPALASFGVCAYIAGSALPLPWDAPLLILALLGGLALILDYRDLPNSNPVLFALVFVFVTARLLSTALSENIGRSVRLGTAFPPGVLLFVLIAGHFRGVTAIRVLYVTFASIGLGLSSGVLWTAWRTGRLSPFGLVADLGSPIIVVPNDLTLLSVIAPLSLSLVHGAPGRAVRTIAALSLVSSVGAIILARSRVALLTLILSVSLATALIRMRLAIVAGVLLFTVALLGETLLGFPLTAKFLSGDEGRIGLWAAAWAKFLEAPWLGHGPHTFVYTEPGDVIVTWAHNLYLEVLMEQGLVGLLTLAALLGFGLAAAWNTQHAVLGEARYLCSAAFAALIAFCFAAVIESSFSRQWVVITFFALLGTIARLTWAEPI